MKRTITLILLAASVAVFAGNEKVRTFIVEQYRNIVDPLFGSGQSTQPKFDTFYIGMVESLPTQKKAERALEMAINRFDGAAEYVTKEAQSWRGDLEATNTLVTLTTTALNAPLIEIRMAGFESYLAQYDLDKTPEQIDKLLRQYERKPEKNASGALWAIAAIAVRGIDRERVYEVLTEAIADENPKIRLAGVEALARFGGQEIIEPLLFVAQHDESPVIQERAYCGVAQTGTLQLIERYDALPTLIQLANDSETSDRELGWIYQALKEISHFYDIPNQPELWEERLIEAGMLRLERY